ncbi:hypothetical protein EB001_16255, partial [bacterium]|nr:hypothetical protein [bacterium]
NLQEWQDSTGTVLAKMSIYGLSMQAGNNIGADYFTSRTNGGGAYLIINGLSVTAQQRDASYPTFIVKGVASQTANLQEWQNSAGSIYAKVDSSGNIYSRNNFQSLASDIYLIDSGGTAFRSVRAGAWADSVDTRFFQVGSSSDRIAFTAQNGTSATRIQFNSAYTTISNYFYGSTPVPSAILNVLSICKRKWRYWNCLWFFASW